jgi:hypothetical protein
MSVNRSDHPPSRADLIFVLAGGEHRKRYALELLDRGIAARILFSVSRFEIRRFANLSLPKPLDLLQLASTMRPALRHFFVFFEGNEVQVTHVHPARFGTLTEIEALQSWLALHPSIRSIVLTSCRSHLRRVAICCRAVLSPDCDITLTPAPSEPIRSPVSVLSAAILEAFKTCIYSVLFVYRRWLSRRRPQP